MIYHFDKDLKGHGLIFDGPLELLSLTRKANEGKTTNFAKFANNIRVNWPGRVGRSWQDLENFVKTPWPEAVRFIKTVIHGILQAELPKPKSLKRKGRWNDLEGDLSIDRALTGEPEMYRRFQREQAHGPVTVTLMANLDAGDCNKTGVWFRSAVCIALADILENIGYSVEIWSWCLGCHVYPEPNHNQFTAFSPKKAGYPVDMDALCDSMSHWFTYDAIYGSFACCPSYPTAVGSAIHPEFDVYTVEGCTKGYGNSTTTLKDWMKYIDTEVGSIVINLPMVTGNIQVVDNTVVGSGVTRCQEVAKKVLEIIIEKQAGPP